MIRQDPDYLIFLRFFLLHIADSEVKTNKTKNYFPLPWRSLSQRLFHAQGTVTYHDINSFYQLMVILHEI